MMAALQIEFEDFVRTRHTALVRTAVLLVRDHGHAEDLVQEALWRTHRHWPTAATAPDSYVRRVLINLARDRHRRFIRRVRETPWSDATEAAEVRTAPQGGSFDRDDALLVALAALPLRQRATVVLRFWDDLSVEETALTLGCTEGTVKSTTSKGLARLREVLAGTDAESELTP